MQRHRVVKWFAASLLGAALAAALVLDLSLVRSTTPARGTQPLPLQATPQQAAQAEPKHVIIEPSRIEIVARRLPPQVAAGANPARRKQQG